MADEGRYDFQVTVAVKVIIRKGGKILLTQEPKEASWRPGKWGLPGGKVVLNEGLAQALTRKIKGETGMKCTVRCLFKMVEILMPEKNVYHFVYAADYMGDEKTAGEKFTAGLKWVNASDFEKISADELTEYYMKAVVGEFFEKPFSMADKDIFRMVKTFEDKKVQEWSTR